MRTDDPSRDPAPADDDIEILEVVGLDDDMPPPSGVEDDGAADEVEVRFEHGAEPAEPARAVENDPGDRERVLRLQAEFENFKRRVDREKADFYRHATSELVERLLPVVDNFDRALLHAREDPREAGPFRDGIGLIHKQLLEVLTKHGLTAVETVDRPFDPEVHEAVATEESTSVPANTVLAEFQRGYLFHGRLLRPAMVKVSTVAEESPSMGSAATSEQDGEA